MVIFGVLNLLRLCCPLIGRCYRAQMCAFSPVFWRCSSPCRFSGLLLLLYQNRKAWYQDASLAEIEATKSDPNLVDWELVRRETSSNTTHEHLRDFMVRQRYGLRRDVRSCMMCQQNGGRVTENDIHCLATGRTVWMSSSACDCPNYHPAEGSEEASELITRSMWRSGNSNW